MPVPYDYSLDTNANHAHAAKALADKFEWVGTLVGGGLPDGNCVFEQAIAALSRGPVGVTTGEPWATCAVTMTK